MNSRLWRLTIIALLLPVALLAAVHAGGSGDLIVIQSTDPLYYPGDIIEGGRTVRVSDGAEVVLIASTGQLVRLAGPHEGAPQISPAPSDPSLLDSLSRLIVIEDEVPEALAVFRGKPRMAPGGRADLWGIDIAEPGRYCVREDTAAMIWWEQSRPGARVSISTVDHDAQRVDLRWPSKGRFRPWPRELPIADGSSYRVRFKSRSAGTRVDIVSMPSLRTDAHRAAWMTDHGCTGQAVKVLNALREGSL